MKGISLHVQQYFHEAKAEAEYLKSIQLLEPTNDFSWVLNNHVGNIHCEQAGNIFIPHNSGKKFVVRDLTFANLVLNYFFLSAEM